MYVKYQNAAIFVEPQSVQLGLRKQSKKPIQPEATSASPGPAQLERAFQTLWADRPFVVKQGKLIGVRQKGNLVEVALMASGATTLTWADAAELLSQSQVNRWLASCSFR